MDDFNTKLNKDTKDERPLAFNIPGSLQIFYEKTEGVTQQLSNLDGFRIDYSSPENQDLHYVQYNGKFWEKMVLKNVKLKAMRSVRGCPKDSNSHVIEFCYLLSLEKPVLSGIKIITASDKAEQLHYEIGTTSGDNVLRERRYYNAGLKSLTDVIQICNEELNYLLETTNIEINNIHKILNNIEILGD